MNDGAYLFKGSVLVLAIWLTPLADQLSVATAQTQVTCDSLLFQEDFESGLGQWAVTSTLSTTTAQAFEGTRSVSFTSTTTGSSAPRTIKFPVTPGDTHFLSVAYLTFGGGGYIGVDQFDAAITPLGEQWLIGDGGDASNLSTWDYNIFDMDLSDLGIWRRYQQEYTIPPNVHFIDIKIEDFSGGLPNDVVNGAVFFDDIEWCASPPTVSVQIDIKPGSEPNSINLSSAGVVPVAILSSSDFDAPVQVNPDTIALAGATVRMVGKSGKLLCHSEDVNGDAREDLVCQVVTAEFMIEPGDSVAVLEAETFAGAPIRGADSIRIVPD